MCRTFTWYPVHFFLYNFVGNIYCMKLMPLGNSCQGWAVCGVLFFSLLNSLSSLKLSLMVLSLIGDGNC